MGAGKDKNLDKRRHSQGADGDKQSSAATTNLDSLVVQERVNGLGAAVVLGLVHFFSKARSGGAMETTVRPPHVALPPLPLPLLASELTATG